jgi:hypothetical protein
MSQARVSKSLESMSDWPLASAKGRRDDPAMEPLVSHGDVTTIMELLGDMRTDLHAIRILLEEDDGEEEEDPEAHT